MKIMINGITLDQYSKSESKYEELKYSLENIDIVDYDEFDYLTVSNEASILGDMIKGTVKGAFQTAKVGAKGVKMANKQWTNAKNNWQKVKPQLIKVLKDMALNLTNMWNKFLKYDEKYKELGKKMNNIISFSLNQMQTMPDVRLSWHNFNAKLLKSIMDLVSNWFNFVSVIVNGSNGSGSGIFDGSGNMIPTPLNIANAIKQGNTDNVRTMVQDFSKGIANLNAKGDLTVAMVLDRIFGWRINFGASKESRNLAKTNEIGLSEYVKDSILGEEVQKEYNNDNKEEFVRDMTGGEGSYLRLVSYILNNDIIADALKKGGASTKKGTDAMIKELNKLMDQTEVAERVKADRDAKEEAAKKKEESSNKSVMDANNAENKDQNKAEQNQMYEEGQQFGSSSNSKQMMNKGTYDSGDMNAPSIEDASLSDLVDLYSKNYIIFITKLSNTYANLVRGILSATYDIISEADVIISMIESAANRTR